MSLYHYTNINSLFSIINSKEIWATNSKYLNDLDDILHFKQIVLEQVEKNKTIMEQDYIIKYFERHFNNISKNVFVISFSLRPDLFNLWSYFAEDNGCNLSINDNAFMKYLGYYKHDGNLDSRSRFFCGVHGERILIDEKHNKSFKNINVGELLHGKVIYNDQIKRKMIKESFEEAIEEPERTFDEIELITELFIRNAYFFKKEGFESEDEYRVIFQLNEMIGTKEIVSYRSFKNMIIPYIRVSIDNTNIIDGIKVGPWENKERIKTSIEDFLIGNDFEPNVTCSELNIRKR